MMANFRFHGSLTQALRATQRNVANHALATVLAAGDAAWRASRGGTQRPGIPVDTGRTRFSAKAWVGRESFRRVAKGRYGPRSVGEFRRAMASWKLGQRFGISVREGIAGLLAYNRRFRSGPRAGQLPSRKVREGVGFFGEMLNASQAAYKRAAQNFRPEGPR